MSLRHKPFVRWHQFKAKTIPKYSQFKTSLLSETHEIFFLKSKCNLFAFLKIRKTIILKEVSHLTIKSPFRSTVSFIDSHPKVTILLITIPSYQNKIR
ncbi:hypothetical protein MADA3029_780002 [Vibrio nigripulchritudo MADA3029]|nr:hypothetical protein VIBNIMADA3020_510001 [Vibrio nigripulchritudo MADA3020]CCN56213.1 hypothetical protein VIBNIMADA3021_900002 [Vibrio nigripulchritudo MADA3021]CCN61426.1 hypothetical protein MADA3029_780002 [Vibrio nigripulchritudo MADA3029]